MPVHSQASLLQQLQPNADLVEVRASHQAFSATGQAVQALPRVWVRGPAERLLPAHRQAGFGGAVSAVVPPVLEPVRSGEVGAAFVWLKQVLPSGIWQSSRKAG